MLVRQFYKRILRRGHTMLLPNGVRFYLPLESKFATEAYLTNANVDWGSEQLLRRILTGSGAFIDVGANIGYYSLYLHDRAARVFAFEPDPRARSELARNVAGHPSIEVIPMAASNHDGQARLELGSSSEVSRIAESGQAGPGAIPVDVVTIDRFVENRAIRVEAIKTDVEGHDLEVLIGARQKLLGQRSLVLTEARPTGQLISFAQEIDYAIACFAWDDTDRLVSFVDLEDLGPTQETKMLFLVPREAADRLRQGYETAP